MDQSKHLKPIHDDRMQDLIRKSHPGMAHWAGTGPEGKTCRQCRFFYPEGHFSKSNKLYPGHLKPGACRRFQKMTGTKGEKVPHTAAACKFFSERDTPPPAIAP